MDKDYNFEVEVLEFFNHNNNNNINNKKKIIHKTPIWKHITIY